MGRVLNMGLAPVLMVLVFFSSPLFADPIDSDRALQAAQGWLNLDSSPLARSAPSVLARSVKRFADEGGRVLYHVVFLEDRGLVVVSGDDGLTPVIAWLPEATEFTPSSDNPLYALLESDVRGRLEAVGAGRAGTSPHPLWSTLLTAGASSARLEEELSDVRVAPFVESRWGQTEAQGLPTYNYYTPNGYPCGCVATAMAQIMRYHEYPVESVGTDNFLIAVDGEMEGESLLGGDGLGRPYHWADMVLDPEEDEDLTEAEREAIGALAHDAGVAVNTEYWSTGSGALGYKIETALESVFDFESAEYTTNDQDFAGLLTDILNSNCDAGLPSLLAVTRPVSNEPGSPRVGHAVLCDGYGYQASVLYHHINLGWSGYSDAWYNLPEIDTLEQTYDSMYGITYNIYPEGSGEIISGRVTDARGNPLAGAIVQAESLTRGAYVAQTDEQGIYALAGIPPETSYMVNVTKDGYGFDQRVAQTGLSDTWSTGNIWGVDFTARDEDYTGWWWQGEAASGTGISVEQQEGRIYLAWYVYDEQGRAVWYSALMDGEAGAYAGDLYRYTGWALESNYPETGYSGEYVGSIGVEFSSADQASLVYDDGEASYELDIQRFMSGELDTRDIQGWWWDEDYPGMGVFVESRGGQLFAAWYQYREDGSPRWWISIDEFTPQDSAYTGQILQYVDGQTLTGPWSEAALESLLGEAGMEFQDDSATLTWQGYTYTLQRFIFGD